MGREERVAVYGLGYVGMALAAVMLRAGFEVVGVDISERRVAEANSGHVKHVEAKVREAVLRGVREGRFRATLNGVEASRECKIKLVTVPVYLNRNFKPDFSSLKSAVKSIGLGAAKGDLVVLESSVPPGTTLRVVKPVLEESSGLVVGEELLLAYSPERIYIGRSVEDIEERYPKVVAGVGDRSLKAAVELYSRISRRGVLTLSSPTAAEFEKLAEGVYRDVNIALANELAKLCTALGIDYEEVRNAANSQPFSHLHMPGVGVGGYCVPVYPYFLMYAAERAGVDTPLVKLAREVNASMPSYVAGLVEVVRSELGLGDPRIAVLGLAFRGGIDDTRLSPTYDLLNHLLKKGFNDLVVHDPYVASDPLLSELEVELYRELLPAIEGRNLVVIATDHPEYRSLSLEFLKEASRSSRLGVVDGRLVVGEWRSPPQGVVYIAVGRPLAKG